MGELESCIKNSLNKQQIVEGTETYKISLDEVKETIKHCNKLKSQLIKQNKKLLKKDGVYLIMTERGDTEDLMKKIGIVRKDKKKSKELLKIKRQSKKSSRTKKLSKESLKIKRQSKKSSKKLSKESLKTNSKLGRPRKNK